MDTFDYKPKLVAAAEDKQKASNGRLYLRPNWEFKPGGECGTGKLADMDRSIVLDQHDRFDRPPRHGAVELIKLFEMRHEITTPFGGAGMDDKLACHVIERTQHGDFPGLSRRRHAQVGT